MKTIRTIGNKTAILALLVVITLSPLASSSMATATSEEPLDIVARLACTDITSSSMTLEWEALDGADGYDVFK